MTEILPVQASQAPSKNPLDQLRDIHLPEQIDQFPSAPGWWILLAIIIVAIGYYFYRVYRYHRAIRILKPARIEIAALRRLRIEQVSAHSIADLSALIKRICLIYFPNRNVASLTGNKWFDFLNNNARSKNSSNAIFSDAEMALFNRAAYQQNPNIGNSQWLQLLASSEQCIENIVKTSAKRKPKKSLPIETGEQA